MRHVLQKVVRVFDCLNICLSCQCISYF